MISRKFDLYQTPAICFNHQNVRKENKRITLLALHLVSGIKGHDKTVHKLHKVLMSKNIPNSATAPSGLYLVGGVNTHTATGWENYGFQSLLAPQVH